LAEQYRTALLKRERAASLDLLTRYGHAWQRTHTLSQALIAEIEAKRLAGLKITHGAIQQNERYKALLAQLEDEMRRLTPYTEMVVRGGQYDAIAAADGEALALARAGIAGIPEPAKDALFSGWNRLPTDAAEALVGVLQDGSPLSTLLQPLGAQTVKGIGDALTTGIVLGHNPEKIAGSLRDAFGLTTTRSLRIARTEVLRAYRTAHILSYRENPQIVKGWRWSASKSLRTCFLAGTMVTTESGPKPIETVSVGERVLTHAGFWRPVTERMAFDYAGKTTELRTESGHRLVSTADHPVLIRRQGNYYWMAAQLCQPGDELWRCVNGEIDQVAHDSVRLAIEGQIGQANNPIASLSQPGDFARVSVGSPVPVDAVNFEGGVDLGQVEINGITVDGRLLHECHADAFKAQSHIAFRRGLSDKASVTMDRTELLISHRRNNTKFLAAIPASIDLRRSATGFRTMPSAVVRFAKQFAAPLANHILGLTVAGFRAIDLTLFPQRREHLSTSQANFVNPRALAAAGTRAVDLSFAPLINVKRLAASRANLIESGYAVRGRDALVSETAVGRTEFAPAFGMAGRLIEGIPTMDASNGNLLAFELGGIRFHSDMITHVSHNDKSATVFNLEVAEDHSYVADGFVVHNCIACIWLDGTIHTLDEFFPAHVACRCAPTPVTPTWAELGIKGMTDLPAPETGQAWFMSLSKPEQTQILGGPMFRAWEAGAIKPADFWRWDHDPTWGSAPQVNSLKGLLGEGAAEFYG